MSGDDKLLRTIESVHAAGLDETRWPDALASVARLFGARAATLEDFQKGPMRLAYLKTAGVPPQGETAYLDYYAHNNSRAGFAFRNLSKRLLWDYEFTTERAMDRDPYYAKYLGPLELRYFLSGQISNTRNRQAIVSIQRTRREGHVGKPALELMNLLIPHVSQAYDVTRRLADARAKTQTFEQALGWLRDAVALLSRDGSVVYANDALQEIARRGDGLAIGAGAIHFADAEARSRFAQALAALSGLADGGATIEEATDFLAPRTGGAQAYIVSLRPLAGTASREHGAAAILFVRDPAGPHAGDLRLFRSLYGLTEAEASLALALCAGTSPVRYARANGISANTVYTHLRRIKEKTRTSGLADLIYKLNDLRAALRPATNTDA